MTIQEIKPLYMQNFVSAWEKHGDEYFALFMYPYIIGCKDRFYNSYIMRGDQLKANIISFLDPVAIMRELISIANIVNIKKCPLYTGVQQAIEKVVQTKEFKFNMRPFMSVKELLTYIELGWKVDYGDQNVLFQGFSVSYIKAIIDFYLIEVLQDQNPSLTEKVLSLSLEQISNQIKSQEYTPQLMESVAMPWVNFAIQKLIGIF